MGGSLVTAGAVALSLGVLYAVLGVGFALLYGLLGEVNLAFGDAAVLALLVSAAVFSATGSVILTALAALAVGVLASVAVERFAVAPLRGRGNTLAPIIATVGAALILRNLSLTPFGAEDRSYPQLFGSGALVAGTTSLDATVIAGLSVLLGAAAAGAWAFRRRWGRAVIAVRDAPVGARLLGIPAARVSVVLYAIAGLLGAVGGVLVGAHVRTVGAELSWRTTLLAFTAAIIGGGSLRGAALGGFALGGVEAVAQVLLGSIWAEAFALLLLVSVILLRPRGLRRALTTSRT
ncbi:MAG: branched-chain amino acid ABC transporter permease [Candidatus Dormibacteraeota bacterium]|uniref:Branched-chain amino acid ABC transporter permease n=1 Tax=Candidatus Amunia macphersoniae TaxID=3127014 RepID=A0A934KS32_9BACT|nr:branched-chain amino acid ABC transporter permease [Candidatus Dormibacteraeota bacterium]